jgi:hypothetical protein
MRNIDEFIIEKLELNPHSKVNQLGSSLKDFNWSCKHISKEDFFKYALEACKQANVYPSDVLEEIGNFEDPDELERQWEQQKLTYYNKWEDTFTELVSDDDKYSGKEGDIADYAFGDAYDIFNRLYQLMGNQA